MQVMDGYEATKKMLAMGCRLPIIGLTANATVTDRNTCLKCGMVDVVTKPFKSQLLISVIEKHVTDYLSKRKCSISSTD